MPARNDGRRDADGRRPTPTRRASRPGSRRRWADGSPASERLARWRDAWDVDVDLGDRTLPLHARGEREAHHAMPYWIADERRTHDLLERHGVPVPHVYGYCDAPYTMVMDRLAGFVDLSFADDDEQRAQIDLEYLELLPRIYGIPLDEARAAGFHVPADRRGARARPVLRASRWRTTSACAAPDPVCEFLRRWLHRHHPRHRTQARFITYDAFQFMFDAGRITGADRLRARARGRPAHRGGRAACA